MLAPEHKALLTEGVVHCGSIADVPIDAVRGMLDRSSFACLRGLVSPEEVARAKRTWRECFDPRNDRVLDPGQPELVRQNFQCVFDRDGKGRAGERPQFLRAFYNPLWDADLYGMHDMFRTAVRVRNLLMGLPVQFAEAGPERGVWTATRIHHYPRALGYMAPHMDTAFSSLVQEFGIYGYYQITLLMSRKGVDYHEGGAYFVRHDARVHFEEEYEIGDVMIHDGRIVHGVEKIDPREAVDPPSPAGRLAAFANLYRLV
jgi:hypothetical protein